VRQLYVVPRHRLLLAAWLTALALPILVIDNIPKTEARAQASVEVIAPADVAAVTTAPATSAPATTAAPTTAAPTPQAPATTAPARKAAATLAAPTTTAPRTTTTAPAPPATTQMATEANAQEGGASWYAYNPGECAHQTIPKGTVVTVTNLATGASTTCVVTDRGPYGAGRIIDLDRTTFAQLADPSAGVIQVRITW
jgi:rare lipoprotein A (peptidoglycan hydrolase)